MDFITTGITVASDREVVLYSAFICFFIWEMMVSRFWLTPLTSVLFGGLMGSIGMFFADVVLKYMLPQMHFLITISCLISSIYAVGNVFWQQKRRI